MADDNTVPQDLSIPASQQQDLLNLLGGGGAALGAAWTMPNLNKLRTMLGEGKSYEEVTNALGGIYSKNAVRKRANQLGLEQNKWPDTRLDRLRTMRGEGKGYDEIANEFGNVNPYSVMLKARELGLTGAWNPERENKLRDLISNYKDYTGPVTGPTGLFSTFAQQMGGGATARSIESQLYRMGVDRTWPNIPFNPSPISNLPNVKAPKIPSLDQPNTSIDPLLERLKAVGNNNG